MNRSTLKTALAALLILGSGTAVLAQDDDQPRAPKPRAAKPHPRKKPAKPIGKQVDINSASKDELQKVPGITPDLASRIIAGRPYVTKSHLVEKNAVPMGVYLAIKDRVFVKQNMKVAPKGK
ncbi:helix-hairpin-helix domain-containing protein [Geothrix sp. 21YS21S-2]|uniref:ComEA family DNA-binding protein n=1 Tax=Geothrix sp. 21YS21S-2 TaxID=3068893 RepID=UPI0027BAA12B|nr:helix-hairpin-helix domain-containing protein [Geothrix sp. 21YS21S-2]